MRRRIFGVISGIALLGLLALFALIGLGRPDQSPDGISRLSSLALTPSPPPVAATWLDAGRRVDFDRNTQDGDYAAITPADVDGNLLVATGTDLARGRALLVMNLETGALTRVTAFRSPTLMHNLHISGERVVWVEEDATSGSPATLYMVDLADNSERRLQGDDFSQVDFQDGVVAWHGVEDGIGGLYGYDVNAAQPFVIDQNAYAHLPKLPRVCNSEWLIYLLSPTGALPHLAQLIAFNHVTGERVTLGELPITTDPASAYQHACDGAQVAWAARHFEEVDGKVKDFNQVHLFDLSTRTGRLIDKDAPMASKMLMDGDLILLLGFRNTGYDLANHTRFEADAADLPHQGVGVPVMLSDDRLLWFVDPEAEGLASFYVTTIVRDR